MKKLSIRQIAVINENYEIKFNKLLTEYHVQTDLWIDKLIIKDTHIDQIVEPVKQYCTIQTKV